MSGEYIFDSNIVIDIFRGNQQTIQKIAGISRVYVPAIVLGELYYGAYKSNQTALRLQQIQQFEKSVDILHIKETTSLIYGGIKNQLRQIGKPIPENDI